jgi:hypothetical protein
MQVIIELVPPESLRHIEGFSSRRVAWLRAKVERDGRWTKPLAIDDEHALVMDGQHRMEVALELGLRRVPAVKYSYAAVEIWSLRPRISFTWRDVVARALAGDPYPYKTVKHRFPGEAPACDFRLEELMR